MFWTISHKYHSRTWVIPPHWVVPYLYPQTISLSRAARCHRTQERHSVFMTLKTLRVLLVHGHSRLRMLLQFWRLPPHARSLGLPGHLQLVYPPDVALCRESTSSPCMRMHQQQPRALAAGGQTQHTAHARRAQAEVPKAHYCVLAPIYAPHGCTACTLVVHLRMRHVRSCRTNAVDNRQEHSAALSPCFVSHQESRVRPHASHARCSVRDLKGAVAVFRRSTAAAIRKTPPRATAMHAATVHPPTLLYTVTATWKPQVAATAAGGKTSRWTAGGRAGRRHPNTASPRHPSPQNRCHAVVPQQRLMVHRSR